MSTFDIITDAPGLLRAESLNIEISFVRTSDSTGRISWTIPTPAAGCLSTSQAYCGMLVTLDTSPATVSKVPVDGVQYQSDPTASTTLFAGDVIGSARVVGAFYNDRSTSFFDVTGISPTEAYYISGYPVDCEFRYFQQGVHAYSTEYTSNHKTDDTHGSQVVVLNPTASTMGVKSTELTNLMPGIQYQFKMQLGVAPKPTRPVDSVECTPNIPTYTISVDGSDARTYDDLIRTINRKIALLSAASQGPASPGTGSYVYDPTASTLSVWTGDKYAQVPVIAMASDPTLIPDGTKWFNPATRQLSNWSATSWSPLTFISSPSRPDTPTSAVLWFNGVEAHRWNGITWCAVHTLVQSTDPSIAQPIAHGTYWYNEPLKSLFCWDADSDMWITVIPSIVSSYDATLMDFDGNTWFEPLSDQLFKFVDARWVVQPHVVATRAPDTPTPYMYWVDPTTHTVRLFDGVWTVVPSAFAEFDPTTPQSCSVWFNPDDLSVHAWDDVTHTWMVASIKSGAADPSSPPTLPLGTVWVNTSADPVKYSVWNGVCFTTTPMITNPIDPRLIADGTVWHRTTDGSWFSLLSNVWHPLSVVSSATAPNIPAVGTMWFNTATAVLNQWNGVAWIPVAYSTSKHTPSIGTTWFDTANDRLMVWNGTHWDVQKSAATVELDCNGNLKFTDTSVGSTSFVYLSDVTLFKSLPVPFAIHNPTPGFDGVSSDPVYNQLGVGTDGTDNIRSSLANDIRYELGYPVMDVELTHEQIDYAISKAISELRSKSGLAYKRGFFFMELLPETQRYYLTNKIAGHNKIVEVIGVYRMTSAFLSSAHGAGVYGQIVLQHLYSMGTFDLLSYHIMAEYTKLMEQLFAAKITFTWDEQSRELFMHHRFARRERMVCIEATVERTEQDILADRYAKPWIRKYVGGMCRIMLAEIRGKYSSLPGAGGNVALNAGELRTAGNEMIQSCMDDIDMFLADRPEEYGMGGSMLFG